VPLEGNSVTPLDAVKTVLYLVVFLFLIALIVRIAFDWIQFFSREWRPRGPVLVFAEGAYTATDPAVRTLRRLIPPLRLGAIQFDLAILILFLLTGFLLQILAP
jgi:YggT family protein